MSEMPTPNPIRAWPRAIPSAPTGECRRQKVPGGILYMVSVRRLNQEGAGPQKESDQPVHRMPGLVRSGGPSGRLSLAVTA